MIEARAITSAETARTTTSVSSAGMSHNLTVFSLVVSASMMVPASEAICEPTEPLSDWLICAANCSNHVQKPAADVVYPRYKATKIPRIATSSKRSTHAEIG